MLINVTTVSSTIAIGICASSLKCSTKAKYLAKTRHRPAKAPEVMTVNIHQPYKKATRSPYASLRYKYTPPVPGNRDANSANVNAPVIATTPPINQTIRISFPVPSNFATSEGAMKIPEPIQAPAAIIVNGKNLIDL